MTFKRLALILVGLAIPAPAPAQNPPSPAEVLGTDIGERFTDGQQVLEYAERLSAASPNVRMIRYGESVEGRDLVLLAISSRENLGDLEGILERNARLLRPDLSADDANRTARSNPAIVWFTYGVHGDESSSTEAALWTAWDLTTDRGASIRDSLVVLIDPNANPDGRERYVSWYRSVRGARPDSNPLARGHRPPWPGGRTNHYNFDLNRDWGWGTQVETRARLAEWSVWNPQVHVDFHEMWPNSTYFFFPAASPHNPIYPDYTLRWGEYFGRANAAEFDRRRWLYYTEESFDLFYPGYGDSWPSLVGAIGMTFEQAGGGRAGLAVERDDGRILTLAERATHHRVSGWSTLSAAMARKTDLLMEFAAFHRGLQSGFGDVLLVPGDRPATAEALVVSLRSQGIAVERARRSFRVASRPHPGFSQREDFPAGTYLVRSNQPRGRLALTLLQPETLLDPAEHLTYDIAAWSMPYAYGVEAHMTDVEPAGEFVPVSLIAPAAEGGAPPQGAYGYLVQPAFEVMGPILRYLEAGGRAVALRDSFETPARTWPAGTFFLPGDDSAAVRLRRAGLMSAAYAVDSGLTIEGHDLGTGRSLTLRAPSIGLLSGPGLSPASFGAAWYLVEQLLGAPASPDRRTIRQRP